MVERVPTVPPDMRNCVIPSAVAVASQTPRNETFRQLVTKLGLKG